MLRTCTFFIALFVLGLLSNAQPIVKMRTGNVVNILPEANPSNSPMFNNCIYNQRYYVWLQFNSFPTEATKQALKNQQVELYNYLPDKTFIASFPVQYNFNQLYNNLQVYGIIAPLAQYKIDHLLLDPSSITWAVEQDSLRKVYVSFIPTVSREQIAAILLENGNLFTRLPNEAGEELVVKASMQTLQKIAQHPLVNYIEPIGAPAVNEDLQGITNHRNSLAFTSDNWVGGRKLNGEGEVIVIGDDGFIGPHIDFTGRIASNANDATPANTHGDHCSGIILSAGNLNPNVRGQAPAATLKAFDDYNDFNQFPSLYTIDNARTSSHSLGQTCNSGYNSNARTSDQQIVAYTSLMHVHSAGNSGTTNCGGLTGGWKTITGGFKSGKNVITVANLSKSDFIDATSSKGPLPDGRLKPDVSAVGASVNSTQPDNNFAVFSGTSMACPAVAGNVAILNQTYKKQNLVEPNSGLIKAILMNTSDDMGNEGPDFTYGFGRINMRRAIECIESNRFLSGSVVQNGLGTHTIQIPANVFKVKVMVYWVDVAGSVGVSPSLVNDLDATLIAANQTIFKPWQMYAGAVPTNESCNTPAIKGTDTLNNVEQIEIDNPSSGAYQLNVNGTKVPSGPQNYFVVIEYLYNNEIVVTHPFGGESFVAREVQRLRWDATGTAGNFDIHYSTDAGSSWSLVTSNVSGSQRFYDWTVPTGTSDMARVRVTRNGFSDMSDTNFIILGVPNITSIVEACAGTSTVTWTPSVNATYYEVFKLGSKFMELVATTTNTSINVNDLGTGINWIAVRASFGARKNGRRSLAVSHTNSSTAACSLPVQLMNFSASKKDRTAILQWQTVQEINIQKYIIERSTDPSFDNSIEIGTVTAKNTSSLHNYSITDAKIIANGTYYYRLKIVEFDKATYSNVQSLNWNSIKSSFVVYPNPAKKVLYITTNENIGAVQIELINEIGIRVLAKTSLLVSGKQETLQVAGLPAGNYFLMIRSGKSNQVISKEQIVIVP